jgi:hypothetical protein
VKLWPFSKKSEAPMDFERKFELPPGVMLASPDEPEPASEPPTTAPGRYDAMHSEEAAVPNEPTVQQEISTVLPEEPEAKPDLPQFFEQNQLEFVSQAQQAEHLTSPTGQTEAPLSIPLPKDAIYQEINNSLTAMADTPPSVEASLFSPLSNTPPITPLPTDAPSVMDFGLSEPGKTSAQTTSQPIPQPVAEEADDAFLFMPEGAAPKSLLPEPAQTEPFNLDMLVPPPFNPTEPIAGPMDPFSQPGTLTEPGTMTDLFYPAEASTLPRDGEAGALCDLSDSFLSETADPMLPMEIPADMDAFFSEEAPSLSVLDGEPQNAQALLDELLKSPEFQQSEHQEAESLSQIQPESSLVESEPEYQSPTGTVPVQEDSTDFFAATFESMDGFDSFACTDNLFMNPDPAASEPGNLHRENPAMPEAEFGYSGLSSDFAQENETSYGALPSEEEVSFMEEPAQDFNTYTEETYFDEDMVGDAELNSEVSSYDYGHYDDPDDPASVISLGEPAYGQTDEATEEDAPDLDALMASLTQARTPECPEVHEIAAATASPPEPEIFMETAPKAETFAREEAPFKEPEAAYHPAAPLPVKPQSRPLAAPQAAASKKATPMQTHSSKPAAKPAPRPRHYNESIADALESFEEEIMLQNNRFFRNSINNLVDQYFAQQEPEDSY